MIPLDIPLSSLYDVPYKGPILLCLRFYVFKIDTPGRASRFQITTTFPSGVFVSFVGLFSRFGLRLYFPLFPAFSRFGFTSRGLYIHFRSQIFTTFTMSILG